jgi:general secretion pathway protein L
MADPLLLRLSPSDPAQAHWLAPGNTAGPESGPLTLAAARLGARALIVLVPGTDVLLTHAQLPPARSSVKLQQLVPFALEEQLAEDIDTLHFALGRRDEAGRTPVAVVARARMSAWLAALGAAGLQATALYADTQLLPANPAQTVALLEHDAVTVRPPGGEAVTLAAEALPEALELAHAGGAGRGLILYAAEADWQRYGAGVEALRGRFEALQVQRLPGNALELFARALPAGEAINLLQGPYAPSHSLISGARAWRWAAGLAVALLGLHLIGQGLELAALHRREHALDAALTQVAERLAPGAADLSEAHRLMAQRLATLSTSGGGGGFLQALGAIARARTAAPGVRLEAISFHGEAATLELDAPSVEALNTLAQSLTGLGWPTQLTGGTQTRGRFIGGLRLHRGS